MAMTPEGKVKGKVRKLLDSYGTELYYFSPAANGYGRVGIPDIIVCYKGMFFGIECKAGSNTPTALQTKELAAIRAAGGEAIVVNEDNIESVREVLLRITTTIDRLLKS